MAVLTERFWSKVDKDGPGGCWLWRGVHNAAGYGYWGVQGRHTAAHRLTYLEFVGPIADGFHIDHLCRNRGCCNPEHLEAVTARENIRRGDGPAAANAEKVVCLRGHDLTGPNLYVRPDGRGRGCRECKRLQNAARREVAL